MQCRDAQFYLRLRRHANDELGGDVTADLDQHLAGCPACGADSRAALAFDRAVSKAMKAVEAPPSLRDNLLTQALAYQGTRLRRTAYRTAAVAALILVACGLAFGVFSASRPVLDLDQLVRNRDEEIQEPDRAIRNWLAAQHFPTQLPVAFNPDLLLSLGTERVQDRDVPVIIFGSKTERSFAKVYLFRENGDFKLDPRLLGDAEASNARAMTIRGLAQAPGVVYVIVYTGRDLQPFLRSGDLG